MAVTGFMTRRNHAGVLKALNPNIFNQIDLLYSILLKVYGGECVQDA
jgi:hypothetical protein